MSVNIEAIVEQVIAETGLNPMLTYCSITGKPIGRLDAETFMDILDAIGHEDSDDIASELVARTLYSMRPSPVWNELDDSTLKRFVKSRPAEVLAYCTNRLFEPHSTLKVPSNMRLELYHQRVLRWQVIHGLIVDKAIDYSNWLYMMIEIDAKYNLTALPIPNIDLNRALDDFDYFYRAIEEWYWPLEEDYLRRLKQAEQQSRWLKGNSLAKAAHFTLFMDSKPPSKAAEKIAAKKESADFFANIFAEVASIDLKTHEITPKPFDLTKVVVPVTTAPRRFGGFKTQEA